MTVYAPSLYLSPGGGEIVVPCGGEWNPALPGMTKVALWHFLSSGGRVFCPHPSPLPRRERG